MEKEITIAHRYWGGQNRRATMTVRNNKVSVQGFFLGYRARNELGPKLENIAEVPKKLRKEVTSIAQHRCAELSRDFSAFLAEVWKKARARNSWFNY